MSDSKEKDNSVAKTDEALPDLPPAWQCLAQPFDKNPTIALDSLYVGDKYLLKCEGEFVDSVNTKWKLVAQKEEDAYKIEILDYRTVENQQFWAEAVSYKPGPASLKMFYWTDGDTQVPLESGVIEIKSALAERPPEVANNPESQKMIMYGPFSLAMPLWYWLMWGGVALTIGLLAFKWISKKLQRKKILEDLSRQSTALTPYNQFQKEIRQQMREFTSGAATVDRGGNYLKALDESFRMYILRELLVPAKTWGSSAVMREIKNRHKKVYKRVGPQVRRVLVEFDRAKKDLETISIEDCEQMREMSRRVVDNVYKIKRLSR